MMALFDKFNTSAFKEKTKKELNEHYDNIELEKGDLPAMFIAAFITFAPLIIAVAAVYIGVAYLFSL